MLINFHASDLFMLYANKKVVQMAKSSDLISAVVGCLDSIITLAAIDIKPPRHLFLYPIFNFRRFINSIFKWEDY